MQFEEVMKKMISSPDENQHMMLLEIMEEALDLHPWYLDLETSLLYASPRLREKYGHPRDYQPIPYEEFLSSMTLITDHRYLEQMKMRVIHEKQKVEFQIHAIHQHTGDTMRVHIYACPLVINKKVVALYGYDRMLETLPSRP